jgi:hypothetical protein
VNAIKAKEDKWIEVIPGLRKGTKLIATNKEPIKRQVVTENRNHEIRKLQETNVMMEDLETKRKGKTRGMVKTNVRKKKRKKT